MTSNIHIYSESVETTTTLGSPKYLAAEVSFTTGITRVVRASPAPRPSKQRRPGDSIRAELESSQDGSAVLAAARRELGEILGADHIAPLAALRLARGMSQSQLSAMSGLPQPQISRLENGGQGDVMLSTVRTLALALTASLEQIARAIEGSKKSSRPAESFNGQ